MPFEVNYSYPVVEEGVLIIEDADAKTLDEAERVALEKLSDMLPEDVEEMNIESIRAI